MKPCVHLDAEPDKRGRIIPRKDKVYKCKCPLPEMPKLPACVRIIQKDFGQLRTWVTTDDCARCSFYKPAIKVGA